MRRIAMPGLLILLVIAVLLSVYLTYRYFTHRIQIEAKAFTTAQSQAVVAADEISNTFAELMKITEELATDLSNGIVIYSDIEDRLSAVARSRLDIDGLAVTFEPYIYDSILRLFQIYLFRKEDGTTEVLRGATYDYTQQSNAITGDNSTAWYVDTINEGAQWHEPFFATGAQQILVEYGAPFYRLDTVVSREVPAGIVSLDYTLQDVSNLIDTLELGATGYGFVISGEGTLLAHPVKEFVVNHTVYDVIEDDALIPTVQNAMNGNADFLETEDPFSGETTWYFFEPIGSTGWTVGIVLNKSQFLPNARQNVRDQMTIALTLSCAIFLALTSIFHADRYRFTNFWAVSATFSVLCVILIVLAWMLTNHLQTQEGISITSQSQLDRYIQSIDSIAGSYNSTVQVRTGFEIQALHFPDPTSATVNGYIWQWYPEDTNVVRGFNLPQRIGEEATIDEVQRETINGEELVVWYIGVTLQQNFDTTRFPFDHRNIIIRITPADLSDDVLLTPDLPSYDLINPQLLPGVDRQISVNNWTLENSRFSYANERSNTNLRQARPEDSNDTPELRFTIQSQRVYLGPFIAYLLPGMIAATMTFVYLLTGHEPGKNDESINVLNFSAALFFVVAVIHTALRDQIAAIGITYLEHIFILLYLAIIAVIANIFVVARYPDWAIVRYQDNLIPKVWYWPIIAGALLVSTLAIFVY